MSRLIDADDLCEKIAEWQTSANYNEVAKVIRTIVDTPTIDAVEVVRCKECKHKQQCQKAVGYITREPTSVTICYKSIDYCSYGEEK